MIDNIQKNFSDQWSPIFFFSCLIPLVEAPENFFHLTFDSKCVRSPYGAHKIMCTHCGEGGRPNCPKEDEEFNL